MKRDLDLGAYLLEALEPRQMMSAGTLDTTFGAGGGVASPGYSRMAVQNDGRILVAGEGPNVSLLLSRYLANGTLDSAFAANSLALSLAGSSGTNGSVGVCIQSDGRIIVADSYWNTSMGDTECLGIVRYNSNGSLDSSFGSGGILKTSLASGDSGGHDYIALQSDGKILVNFVDGDTVKVARYETNGGLDTSFGVAGFATIVGNDGCDAIAVQPDGRIVVLADEETASGNDVVVVRLTSTGQLDSSFGSDGRIRMALDSAWAMVLDASGRIVVAGYPQQAPSVNDPYPIPDAISITRLTASGQLDGNFGSSGTFTSDFGAVAESFGGTLALSAQGDGKILFGGGRYQLTTAPYTRTPFLGRLTASGTLDASFGNNGLVASSVLAGLDEVDCMVMQSDGKIVATGATSSDGGQLFRLTGDAANVTDTAAPTPNPIAWATVPYATGTTSIKMVAAPASDPSGVQYYFKCLTAGGHNSGWQDGVTYQDVGLLAEKSYSYQVQTRDKSANQNAGGWSASKSAATQTRKAPTNIALSSSKVAEHKPAGTVVGTLSATDANTGEIFAYSLVGGTAVPDNAKFAISGNQLKTNASFNYEAKKTYAIRVRVRDRDGLYLDKAFIISVTNVNETPTGIKVSASTVAEHKPAGTVVGTLSATDPDSGNRFSYSLVNGAGALLAADDAAFKLVSTPAGVLLETNARLNYETKSIYNLILRVKDQGGLFCDRPIRISVSK